MKVTYKKPKPVVGKVTIVINSEQAMVLAELFELVAENGPVREFVDELSQMIQNELNREVDHGTYFFDNPKNPSVVHANVDAEVSDVKF